MGDFLNMERAIAQQSLDSSSSISSQGAGSIPELVTILIILLLIATAVALVTQRLKIPYATGLVLAGLPITTVLSRRIGLDPSLVLNLFLPILIFEAAINTDIRRLRSTVKSIALLAGPGSVLSSAIIAVFVKYGLQLDWIPALLIGVILANTDTVSMIAVFKEIRVPSRLSTIVEGETLFNDAAALISFNLLLVINTTGSLTLVQGVRELLLVAIGGALVGGILGYLSLPIFLRLNDPLSSLLLTVALALGTYQIGQFLGVSGAVAVVIAGLIFGNLGLPRSSSASDRITLFSFWEYAGFSVNTFIFLLIGIEINPVSLWNILPSILFVILAYQLGRILSVYFLLVGLRWFDRPIPLRWQHVLVFGNIKGSLSMALAVAMPLTLTGRDFLIQLVFGSVLFSLVVQGLALPWLIRRLNLSRVSEVIQEAEQLQIQLIAAKAAQEELANLLKLGVIPKAVYEELWASYQTRVAKSERVLRDLHNQADQSRNLGGLHRVRRRLLLAEKVAVNTALRKGIVSEDLVQDYTKDINEKLLALEDD